MIRILLLFIISFSAVADTSHYAGFDVFHSYHKFTTTTRRTEPVEGKNSRTVRFFSVGEQKAPIYSMYHGWRLNEYFGIEYGMSLLKSFDSDAKAEFGSLRTKSIFCQGMLFFPCYKTFDVFFGAGLSGITMNYNHYGRGIEFEDQNICPRVTSGFRFFLTPKLGIKGSLCPE